MPMIDLRSDTVTQPTAAMREAMMAAPLGDDVLGDDSAVQTLERKVAALLGKEAALFVPSGTMANQLAIRCHCESGDEIIAHGESHIIHYETGAPAAVSGCMIRPLAGQRGLFDAGAVHAAVRDRDIHSPYSRLLVVENTHNRGGGSVWPIAQFRAVCAAAREHQLAVHVDGARLMNACVAARYSPREFVESADSISICFSKALGAPVGSALVAPQRFIDRARRFRKMLGGGMRQSGFLAAAASYALDNHVERLAQDHTRARALGERIATIAGLTVNPPPAQIESNMVFFDVAEQFGDARELCAHLRAEGVLMIPMGPRRVRAVMHLDVPDDVVERTTAALGRATA
ncbi:MAG: aminotransferase class I/II-fold pyridoxal phosphate-dependent enzyme [Phycisphaerales bacterium]|nr:aminotransferase class I/II-fold pyridoxal phosphate-dependent enzyme [Phycisphaerales bacterium]